MNQVQWKTKLTKQEKIRNREEYETKRRLVAPTRKELKSTEGAIFYCKKRKLSVRATARVVQLVTGVINDLDWRDHRSLPTHERVPRSLEEWCPTTPPRYWDIDDPRPENTVVND